MEIARGLDPASVANAATVAPTMERSGGFMIISFCCGQKGFHHHVRLRVAKLRL
jgi:hypothetical protein